jgi:hypothetical protein
LSHFEGNWNQSLGKIMPKIPECDRCLFYAKTPYLLCTVNPEGVDSDAYGTLRERCLDFQPDPNAEAEELWAPVGWRFKGDELVPNHED